MISAVAARAGRSSREGTSVSRSKGARAQRARYAHLAATSTTHEHGLSPCIMLIEAMSSCSTSSARGPRGAVLGSPLRQRRAQRPLKLPDEPPDERRLARAAALLASMRACCSALSEGGSGRQQQQQQQQLTQPTQQNPRLERKGSQNQNNPIDRGLNTTESTQSS